MISGIKKAVGEYQRLHRIDGGIISLYPHKNHVWYETNPTGIDLCGILDNMDLPVSVRNIKIAIVEAYNTQLAEIEKM